MTTTQEAWAATCAWCRRFLLAGIVVLVAALVLAASMVTRGLQPDAELEGVFLVLGLLVAVPVTVLLVVSIRGYRAVGRGEPRGFALAGVLGVTELLVALGAVASFGVILTDDPAPGYAPGAPGQTSSVSVGGLAGGLLLATLGLTTTLLAVRGYRRAHVGTPAAGPRPT